MASGGRSANRKAVAAAALMVVMESNSLHAHSSTRPLLSSSPSSLLPSLPVVITYITHWVTRRAFRRSSPNRSPKGLCCFKGEHTHSRTRIIGHCRPLPPQRQRQRQPPPPSRLQQRVRRRAYQPTVLYSPPLYSDGSSTRSRGRLGRTYYDAGIHPASYGSCNTLWMGQSEGSLAC